MLAQDEVILNYSLHKDEVEIAEKIKRIMKSIGMTLSKPQAGKDVNATYYASSIGLAHGGRMLFPLPRFRIWTMKGDVLNVYGLF